MNTMKLSISRTHVPARAETRGRGKARTRVSNIAPVYNRISSRDMLSERIMDRMAMPEAPMRSPVKDTVLQMKFEPFFRIMLHYSMWTEDDNKSIAQKVKISVPILTMRECEKIVRHAKSYGVSIVCTIAHDKAILFCDNMVRVGLNATIEEA